MKLVKFSLLVLLSFVSAAINAHDFEVGNIYYNITSAKEKTCEVTKNGSHDNSYSGDVIIPENVVYNGETYVVTGIDYCAFYKCIKLKSISLPNTLTEIEGHAFNGCIMLKEFITPPNVTSLPYKCFAGCASLEKIELGNVQEIGEFCFNECVSLESVTIPGSIIKIGNCAFQHCSALSSLTIEDSDSPLTLSANGINADETCGLFSNCPLVNVYIGRNLKYKIGTNYESPFCNNETLQTVTFGDCVTEIGRNLCCDCPMLEEISGMKNVTTLGGDAFYNCTSLKHFVVGDKVTSLGSSVFSGCTSLESIVLGNGIEKLDNGIMYNCNNLKNLYLGKAIKQINTALSNSLSNANVYLFSDQLSSIYIYVNSKTGEVTGGIPTDVKAVYVANPERYETLLGKYYNVKPMLTFNENSLEYTGKVPDFSYRNNVDGMDVSFDNSATPKDAGAYKTNVDVTFSNDNWSVSVEMPCEYTITKAPLAIIANDAQRCYKEENPELTYTCIGFKNGETDDVFDTKPTVFTTAVVGSNVGDYPIYCSGAEARNYELNYKEGKLTIMKAEQEIDWEQDFDDVVVGKEYELTATTNSGLPIKYRSSDISTVMISSKKGKQYAYMVKPGTAVLTAYQNGDNNYNEAYEVNKLVNVVTTSIDNVSMDEDSGKTYYGLDGKKLSAPIKGMMIVRNGKNVKRVVKK